ncbi:MAG TPA: isoprenylcysteine carboxylmethyltransferase family protein [Pirellulaceae bacterium]|nr:isoprenylcysteine carboxylmethyltransferase family protein [Pirellulaceae bacterium]
MTVDDKFRLILLATFGFFLPFALYYRIRSLTDERLDRWQEGAFILFGLRLSGIPFVIGGIAWMIAPQRMSWASVPLPVWLRWLGLVFVGLGGFLLVWTFRNLGKNLTDTVVTRHNHSLVTTGPYRYVRHPFYLAGVVALTGGCLVSANWFLLISGLVPFGFLVVRTRIEEEKLIERFGEEYRDYMAKTGRFLPKIRS